MVATGSPGTPHGSAPPPDVRSAVVRRLVAGSDRSSSLDRLCELAAALLDAGSAQVSLIGETQVVVGGHGAGSAAVGIETPAEDSLCTVTVGLGAPLVVPDAVADVRVGGLPPVTSGAVGAYLGVPLVASGGQVVGALCVYDVAPHEWSPLDESTLQRLAQAVVGDLELAALSSDYEVQQVAWRLATDAAGVGAWEWDLPSGELRFDDRLLEIFGFDHDSFGGTIEAFTDVVHVEDVPRVTAALDRAIASCGEYAAEYRINLPGGGVRWIAARGRALGDERGQAVRVLGAAYDTTAVQEGEARVARVLESMPTAFFQLDRSWRFAYLNGEAERLLGRSREELAGQDIWTSFPAAVGSDFEHHYRLSARTGEPVAFDAYYPEPLDAWYEVRGWPNPDGLAVYFVDVTARHRAQEQVVRTARRDALVAAVTEQLAGTLDLEEAVARLGALVVPELGDWCVATLVEEPGHEGRLPGLRDVGGWHRDRDAQPLVDRFAEVRLTRLVDQSFLPAVLAADRPIVATGATEGLCSIFEEGEVPDLVRRLAPEHVAVVSLRGRDRVVGLLTVLRDSARGGFSGNDLDTLGQVAERAGLAVDNARLFAEQRDLAEGLQRSLLTAPPQPDHLEIVVRYEAAAETAQVGGDWYDAFVQDAGATMLVIGDVVGHDTAAAAAMGQVRNLLRGVSVFSGLGPGDVLHGVDRALDTLGVDTTATAVLARLEQTPEEVEEGVTRLRWSNAGHPPPAVLTPEGTVDLLLTDDPDLLLGLDPDVRRGEQQVVLRRGSTVLLFTDGLVERRGEDLDVGLERLRRELASLAVGDPPLDELCDRLLARMVPSVREDDIALVAVRLHEQDGPPPSRRVQPGPGVEAVELERSPTVSGRIVRTRFPADPASVPGARRFVREALRGRGAELVDDAELCVGELAANAALHSGGAMMDVSVRLDHGATTVAVTDEGDVPVEALMPRLVVEPGAAHSEPTTGRGLGIVSVLADDWGVERVPGGTRVWARLVDERVDSVVRPPDSAPGPEQGPRADAVAGSERVHLRACPVELWLRQDAHIDELVRDLQLLSATHALDPALGSMSEVRDLLAVFGPVRRAIRRSVEDARSRGLAEVDVVVQLPPSVADDAARLHRLLTATDVSLDEERLLTVRAEPEVLRLRAWMIAQVRGQTERPDEGEPWPAWLRRTVPG
ncbi:putative diguanylate cyclase YegE [Nocardioides dokdonensis FR1436]|uniref:Putative diguanylate cyclase YegE n=1 Tax=Nocardioides dokdonensis FR1436 TaxID=1300347 RepID=A0A1A9GIF5_9ACTN|nr:SpoIIE family protein phosphatase [Nocardioides dokdonensis]ANH38024.1 putative diguanylate cyclase YegE [Nocardioides dokdonensis FR1436]